jgi:hypothetical protein
LEEDLPASADRARISGISPPEFPEPTRAASKRGYTIEDIVALFDDPGVTPKEAVERILFTRKPKPNYADFLHPIKPHRHNKLFIISQLTGYHQGRGGVVRCKNAARRTIRANPDSQDT